MHAIITPENRIIIELLTIALASTAALFIQLTFVATNEPAPRTAHMPIHGD